MSPGDRITIHMHDTSAGFRIDLIDVTTDQSGSMTASVANGFAHVLFTPDVEHLPVGAVRVPPRVQHREPAREHVVGAHVQRRLLRRDRALRALPRSWTRTSTAPSPAPTTRAASTRTTSTTSASRARTRCSSTSTVLLAVTTTSTGPRTRTTGRARSRTSNADQRSTRSRSVHAARLTNGGTRTTRRSPSRPTCPRSRPSDSQDNPPFCDRTTGANCVNPPPARSSTRSTRPTYSNGTCTWQEGGPFIPGHDRRLRRELDRRSSGRCCRPSYPGRASRRPAVSTTSTAATCTTSVPSADRG